MRKVYSLVRVVGEERWSSMEMAMASEEEKQEARDRTWQDAFLAFVDIFLSNGFSFSFFFFIIRRVIFLHLY